MDVSIENASSSSKIPNSNPDVSRSALSALRDEFTSYIKRDLHHNFRSLFKDMEIRGYELRFLIIITFAAVCLASVSIHFSGSMIDRSALFGGSALAVGSLMGMIGGGLLVDRLRRKIPLLTAFFATSPVLSIWGIIYRENNLSPTTPIILFALNVTIVIVVLITVISIFIDYTTMLDRGRVIAIVLVVNTLLTIGMYFLILHGYFALVPTVVPVFVAIWLYRQRNDEKTLGELTLLKEIRKHKKHKKSVSSSESPADNLDFVEQRLEKDASEEMMHRLSQKRSSKQFFHYLSKNSNILYYGLVLSTCGLIIGLLMPIDLFLDVLLRQQQERNIIAIIVFLTVFLATGAFLIGFVFDFYGRKAMLSLIVFAVAVVNFIDVFQTNRIRSDSNIGLLSALIFVLTLTVPLLCGDLAPPEFYGRTSIMWLIAILIGFAFGYFLKSQAISIFLEQFLEEVAETDPLQVVIYNFVISSMVFISVIVILFILSNISIDISKDEQNWAQSLIHLYIVHNSGLLIYEHAFKPEEGMIESDLISGGLIGLVTMLKEITRGNSNLKIIDHGDKKLLFQWDSHEQVIFVLVIERELVFIRYKLSKFIAEFEQKYQRNLQNFAGVNDVTWKSVESLISKYFTTKYLQLIPEIEKTPRSEN
jgi:MFS family permease